MKARVLLRIGGLCAFLAGAALLLPHQAEARVDVSVGIGLPVVVAPAPVVVAPVPAVVYPAPVVYTAPVVVGPRRYGYYGHRRGHWRHHPRHLHPRHLHPRWRR